MPKIRGYAKTFKVKYGHKQKNNKLMSVRIDDEKPLEKYKTIWTKIEDLKSTELNALLVYDGRHITTKIRKTNDKVYINFRVINVSDYEQTNCKQTNGRLS